MIKSYYLNNITYKGKTYKFKVPLRIKIESFIISSSEYGWSLEIPSVEDGYTINKEIVDPIKEAKVFIKKIFDEILSKNNNELEDYEIDYKNKWISLIKR